MFNSKLIALIIIIILFSIPALTKPLTLQYSTKHFIIYHSDDINHYWIENCSSILEKIYESIGERFNFFPKKIITVIIYSKTWQFIQATKLPYHIGAIYDGTLKMQHPKILYKKKILKSILTHEYTHIIINEITKSKIPLWLNEGLATYMAKQNPKSKYQTKIESFKQLTQLLANRKNKNKLQYAYSISLKLVKYLINKYSFNKMINLLHHVNKSKSFGKSFKLIYKI